MSIIRYAAVLGLLLLAVIFPASAELPHSLQPADIALRMFYPGAGNVLPSFLPHRFDSTRLLPDTIPDSGAVHSSRKWLVGGTLLGSMIVIHLYQQGGWWKDNRTSFHFQEDLVYGLSVDKFGHFFGANLLQYSISHALRWADVPEGPALWYGAGGALLFQTYVEVEDGFSTWGFDRVDWASDVAGAAWEPLRTWLPALRTVDMKLSYHSSDLLGNPGGTGFKGQKHLMIDDYEGQTIWFTLKVHDVLPAPVRSWWPDFLGVSLGYGAREISGPVPYRVYFLSPDIDMTRLIPQSTPFLKTLGEVLNFIHLPLPAVRISPSQVWYGAYF
jgi:hypothetical protein